MVDAHFFNDEPFLDPEQGPDLLGHQQYARHMISLLGRVREQTETGVLALIGSWGSGKSSVLGNVTRRLREANGDDGWLIAELNPWLYSDLETLTLALFSEVREALPKDDRWSEVRQRIGGFGQSISPLVCAGIGRRRYPNPARYAADRVRRHFRSQPGWVLATTIAAGVTATSIASRQVSSHLHRRRPRHAGRFKTLQVCLGPCGLQPLRYGRRSSGLTGGSLGIRGRWCTGSMSSA